MKNIDREHFIKQKANLNIKQKKERKGLILSPLNENLLVVKESKTMVIKIGSNSIADDFRLNKKIISLIAKTVSNLMDLGKRVAIVTSGAVVVGMEKNNLKNRPEDTDELQDLAAEGQHTLMTEYEKAFSRYNIGVWQILVTHHNFSTREERENITRRINRAFSKGKVPIINTNDPATKEELIPVTQYSFSDNDPLSAIVAKNVKADLLMIFSDKGNLGKGGVESKMKAINIATKGGAAVIISKIEEIIALIK